jgi:hypothetical protein
LPLEDAISAMSYDKNELELILNSQLSQNMTGAPATEQPKLTYAEKYTKRVSQLSQ